MLNNTWVGCLEMKNIKKKLNAHFKWYCKDNWNVKRASSEHTIESQIFEGKIFQKFRFLRKKYRGKSDKRTDD